MTPVCYTAASQALGGNVCLCVATVGSVGFPFDNIMAGKHAQLPCAPAQALGSRHLPVRKGPRQRAAGHACHSHLQVCNTMTGERAAATLSSHHSSWLSPLASIGQIIHSFLNSLHALQAVDQVHCSRHSMAALQPALSWDFLHQVYESPAICKSSLI